MNRITAAAALAALTFLGASLGSATAQTLAPFKDRLFAYPAVLEMRDGGDYRILDYREMRDINGRDSVPEQRARRQYVDLAVVRNEKVLDLATPAGPLRYGMTGTMNDANVITVFIHGRGGDHTLGMSDIRFGGNFNRIKNLMWRNRGVYLAPDAGSFSGADIARIKTLVTTYLAEAQQAKLVLACGSAGGAVCHALADDPSIVARLAGIALMGSFATESFANSSAVRAGVPIMIAHGSRDRVFNIVDLEGVYRVLKQRGHPVRMVRFETGGHGTPIRMMDWRETVNWFLTR